MTMTRRIALVAVLALLGVPFGQVGSAGALVVGKYVREFQGTGDQEMTDVAVNRTTNDVFAVGWTTTVPNASGPLTSVDSNGQVTAFMSKIAINGSVVWTKEIGKSGHDRWPEEVAIDGDGNAYVILTDRPRIVNPRAHVYVEKWNASGVRVWQKVLASLDGSELGAGIEVSGASVYVTYTTTGTFRTAYGSTDVVVSKLRASTGTALATRQLGTSKEDSPSGGVRVLKDGSVVVSGYTNGSMYLARNSLRHDDDFFFARMDPDLVDVLSSKQWGSTASDRLFDTTALTGGGMMFAGATAGQIAGTVAQGGIDGVIISSSTNGTFAWTGRFGSPGDDYATSIRQSPTSTNVLFAGETGGVTFGASSGRSDIVGGTVSTDGQLLATKQFGTVRDEVLNGLDLRSDASPVLAGATSGSFDDIPVVATDGYVLSAGVDISAITDYVGTLPSIPIVKIPVVNPVLVQNSGESLQVAPTPMADTESVKQCNEVSAPLTVYRKDIAVCAGLIVKAGTKTAIRLSKKNAKGVCSLSRKRRLKMLTAGTCKVKIRTTQRSGRTKAVWITYTGS